MKVHRLFSKGSDLVLALEQYYERGYLKSSTNLVSIRIQNYWHLFTVEQAIDLLKTFLNTYARRDNDDDFKTISMETIVCLGQYILERNWLNNRDRIYQQIRGVNSASPFMALLVDIYLSMWETDHILRYLDENEIYGRFVNRKHDRIHCSLSLLCLMIVVVAKFSSQRTNRPMNSNRLSRR